VEQLAPQRPQAPLKVRGEALLVVPCLDGCFKKGAKYGLEHVVRPRHDAVRVSAGHKPGRVLPDRAQHQVGQHHRVQVEHAHAQRRRRAVGLKAGQAGRVAPVPSAPAWNMEPAAAGAGRFASQAPGLLHCGEAVGTAPKEARASRTRRDRERAGLKIAFMLAPLVLSSGMYSCRDSAMVLSACSGSTTSFITKAIGPGPTRRHEGLGFCQHTDRPFQAWVCVRRRRLLSSLTCRQDAAVLRRNLNLSVAVQSRAIKVCPSALRKRPLFFFFPCAHFLYPLSSRTVSTVHASHDSDIAPASPPSPPRPTLPPPPPPHLTLIPHPSSSLTPWRTQAAGCPGCRPGGAMSTACGGQFT
jgi:hypothetical protein